LADAAAALGAGAAAATAADAAAAVSVVNACPVENANIAFSSTAKAAAACFFFTNTAANAVTAFAAFAIALVAACAAVLHAVIAPIIVVAVFAVVVYAAKVVSSITNKDYKEIIDEYRENENAFIYLDPPYVDSFNTGYVGYQKGQHDGDLKVIDNTKIYIDLLDILSCKCKNAITKYLYRDYIEEI